MRGYRASHGRYYVPWPHENALWDATLYFRCSTYGSWLFIDATADVVTALRDAAKAFRQHREFPLPWEVDTYYAAVA